MKKVRKSIAVLLAALFLLSLAGCGAPATESAASETPEPSAAPVADAEELEESSDAVAEETAAPSEDAQEEPVAEEIPAVRVISWYDSEMSIKVEGLQVLSSGFDALSESLHAHNVQMKENTSGFREEPKDNQESSYENNATITRCDETVLSCAQEVYAYLGMSDTRTYTTGYTYDVVSGKELSIDDVMTDHDLCAQAVVAKLEAALYSEWLTDGWKDDVTEALKSFDDVGWYLETDAFAVVFHTGMPQDTMETVVEIPYSACGDFLNERYLPDTDRICHCVDDYGMYCLEYSFDADHDGTDELLQIDGDYVTNEYHYVESFTPIISFGRDEGSLITVNGEEGMAQELENIWVIEASDGNCYLYLEVLEPDDYRCMMIYDLSDPDAGPVYKGINETGAFYGFAPSDPDHLYVENLVYVMGTHVGYADLHIGADGQIMAEEEAEYHIVNADMEAAFEDGENYDQPAFSFTLLKDVEEYVYDLDGAGEGTDEVLKAGTVLYPYSSGADSYMVFRMDDGKYVTFWYDDMQEDSWERTVQGIPEEELFDGIIYAG